MEENIPTELLLMNDSAYATNTEVCFILSFYNNCQKLAIIIETDTNMFLLCRNERFQENRKILLVDGLENRGKLLEAAKVKEIETHIVFSENGWITKDSPFLFNTREEPIRSIQQITQIYDSSLEVAEKAGLHEGYHLKSFRTFLKG